MDKIPFTSLGLDKIKLELNDLKKNDRPQIIQAIASAREHGDLKENAEYHAAKEKQAFVEGKLSGEKVTFGCKVNILDEDTDQETVYHIVGPYEANLEAGLISIASPIAKALIGKEEGISVAVNTPSGIKNYEILSISIPK